MSTGYNWSIVGHRNICEILQSHLKNDQVAHAYLFVGPQNIGKVFLAEKFVRSLMCQGRGENISVPCDNCIHCRQVINKIHPDVTWLSRDVDEKTGKTRKNISIEQVRELRNKLYLGSFLNSYKIAVIEEAEFLSNEAANALLKTLEEPAGKAVIIIIANEISKLPQTILSRCQKFKFLPVATDLTEKHLKELGAEKKLARQLALLTNGRIGEAVNFYNQAGVYSDYKEIAKSFLSLKRKSIQEKFDYIQKEFSFSDYDLVNDRLKIWLSLTRDLMLVKIGRKNILSHAHAESDLSKLAGEFKISALLNITRQILEAKKFLSANVNPKLILENLILNF